MNPSGNIRWSVHTMIFLGLTWNEKISTCKAHLLAKWICSTLYTITFYKLGVLSVLLPTVFDNRLNAQYNK